MSSTTWGIIGAIVCAGGYQALRYGVGKSAGYVFVGITVAAYFVVHFVLEHRLAKLRNDVAKMEDEDRNRFLHEIDPEIAQDLKNHEHDKENG